MTIETPTSEAVSAETAGPTSAAVVTAARPHLDHLDGIRGLAALYVVFAHIAAKFPDPGYGTPLNRAAKLLVSACQCSRYSVAMFIMLSGYCLMLPVVRTTGMSLRGGFWSYVKRRARRILPPYYIALAISIALVVFVPQFAMEAPSDRHLALAPGSIISHVFLVHNLRDAWIFQINNPMWSVATEWQIYFFFPLLLLPIVRRAGPIVLIIVAFALGFSTDIMHQDWLDNAAPWYLGLFAVGMVAAMLNFSGKGRLPRIARAVPWGALTAVLTVILVAITVHLEYEWHKERLELLAAVPGVCLIIYLGEALPRRTAPPMLQLLRLGPVVALGRISYSLYLTHYIMVNIFHNVALKVGMPRAPELTLMMLVGAPICIAVAYAFHCPFERPFMK